MSMPHPEATKTHPDRLTLELLAIGDVQEPHSGQIETHLEDCQDCRERLWRIRQQLATARRSMPERMPTDAFRQRAATERRARTPWLAAAAGWAVAASVLLIWSPWNDGAGDTAESGEAAALGDVLPTVRARGHFAVSVLRGRGDQVDRLGAVAVCRPGDRLQFEPDLPDHGFFRIVNVQDDGAVQSYLPQIPVTGASDALDFSVELDDYAGGERIFFVWSEDALDEAILERDVKDALALRPIEEIDELPLPRGVTADQRSLLIYKEGSR